jgi:hypothetical protein
MVHFAVECGTLSLEFPSLRPKSKVCHPLIKLTGKYLTDYGFNIGDSCEVIMEKGKIMITKKE